MHPEGRLLSDTNEQEDRVNQLLGQSPLMNDATFWEDRLFYASMSNPL